MKTQAKALIILLSLVYFTQFSICEESSPVQPQDLKKLINDAVEQKVHEQLALSKQADDVKTNELAKANNLGIISNVKSSIKKLKTAIKDKLSNTDDDMLDKMIAQAKDIYETLTPEQQQEIANMADSTQDLADFLKKKWQNAYQLNALDSLNFQFDLNSDNIRVTSDIKDENGKPLITFLIDENGKILDPLAQVLLQDLPSVEVVAPAEQSTEQKEDKTTVSDDKKESPAQEKQKPEVVAVDDKPAEDSKKEEEVGVVVDQTKPTASKLTEEEEFEMQRDVAFKVVFFFISFILFCFGLLYVYHKVQQASVPERAQKQNFFDFLAGNMDEEEYGELPSTRYVR